ncbi:uncharacterized protein Z518_02985 [Rhinocladiella mackenziei CBS 650.93]|uniref:Protection of telomeres protein 1 n=1 Tax=Rhinocladiella mackenziei CBS 650.93 TaxID=1442369 RepID=A0A0D2IQS5_9EURO|nr:uncharacterized protein Z518_02985 [Rhinocladiella mackenziei CBS 650.93]KIX08329.1 hypothetical protein Z518_02985 [Rhinocladiella mackenziei CBS 650.93]
MAYAPVPRNFIDLANAIAKKPEEPYNVIGVCVDYLDATKSRGTDYTIKFVLHDPVWSCGQGMSFRFFARQIDKLPAIRNQGDIVILRNVKTHSNNGEDFGMSHSTSTWVVLPFNELDNLSSPEHLKSKARWFGKGDSTRYPQAVLPNEDELKYARWIARQEDPNRWDKLAGATRLQIESTMRLGGGEPPPRATRFRLIKDLERPASHRGKYWVELLGEVRKIYSSDMNTEIYVTDYTHNDELYDYQYNDNDNGRDGDEFGYTKDVGTKWPGPWGKMTMTVTLWDAHFIFAKRHVKEGSFVYLRNVEIKMARDGSKLEGHCRGDRNGPSRVNVALRFYRKDDNDEQMKALVMRKRDYESKARAENVRFTKIAQDMNKRRAEEPTELEDMHKNKKARARNRKKERRAKAEAEQSRENGAAAEDKSLMKSNVNIRCNRIEVPCKPIVDILDSEILDRNTSKGNPFRLPFQNCRYKGHVRVVDFFPDNIADFAVPRRISEYDALSDDDDDDDDDSDIDLMRDNGEDVKWEWRFFLLVEDARPQAVRDGRPTQMELLVADTDGDFLLNMEACNLRDEGNAQKLATVKEKLFHLWGDLQERKEESCTAESLSVKPNARPFECLIKEYGVPVRSSHAQSSDSVMYERHFRLFGTTI